MGQKPRTENPEIPVNKAAINLNMTPEGVRRLCIRSGFGEKDSRGRWVLTASEIEEIKRARRIVFGGGDE
jgi:hypothetical protein